MADNTIISPASSTGDTIRDKDRSGVKTQIVALDLNPAGAESLMAGVMPVNSADVTSSGTIAALSANVALSLTGQSAGTIQITGTWVGTLQFEGSLDGTTWSVINATAASTSTPSTTTIVNGLFRLSPAGVQQFRIVSTLWTSGTATILMRASLGTAGVYVNQVAPVKIYDGTNLASIFPATFLRTTDEPRQVFYDNFDSAPDTVNVWNSTQGSGGVAAAVVNGILSLGAGTLANGYSKILSIPSFKLPIPGWLGFSDAIALSDGAAPTANVARYWGTFSSPASPTTASPITDGYVFEEATNGKLSAVVYAAGVRTLIADLSSTGTNVQPLDALYHRYLVYVRTDKTYFYIDGVGPSNLVATTNFQSPAIQTLGTGLLVVNGPTPPASNVQIQCAGLAVWDTGKNATQIADGTFPWRKLKVNADGSIYAPLAAQDGTDISTPTAMPAGGVGIRGWLSAIWTKLNGTLGVTGTFWQATQPVSGTFFQTTQPVSLATNTPDVTDRAARLLGVVASITNALPAGTAILGKTGIDQTTDGTTNAVRLLAETTKVIGTVNVAASQTIAATQATAANLNMTATPIAITKGTQGATGFTTQDLKDAGRNAIHFYMLIPVLTSATDTLQSLTGTKGGATVTATTTPAVVTTGKTLRITRLAATYIATATSGYGIVRLRFNTAGVVAVTSPIAATLVVGSSAPVTANSTGSEEAALDEGWEFAAATGVGISVQGFAAVTATAVGYVLVSLTGYEY